MRRLLFPDSPAMAALLLRTPVPAAARTQKPAKPYSPKRLAGGHRDLQGACDIATITPLELPGNMRFGEGDTLVVDTTNFTDKKCDRF